MKSCKIRGTVVRIYGMGGLRRRQKGTFEEKDGRQWLSFKGVAAEMSSGHVRRWLAGIRVKAELADGSGLELRRLKRKVRHLTDELTPAFLEDVLRSILPLMRAIQK